MLNNKKSLLQRVNIAMVAIVTIMGIGSAYAMKAPLHKDSTTWHVVATVGNSYQVTQAAGRCDNDPSPACVITSTTPPVNGLIPMTDANVTQRGNFTKQ